MWYSAVRAVLSGVCEGDGVSELLGGQKLPFQQVRVTDGQPDQRLISDALGVREEALCDVQAHRLDDGPAEERRRIPNKKRQVLRGPDAPPHSISQREDEESVSNLKASLQSDALLAWQAEDPIASRRPLLNETAVRGVDEAPGSQGCLLPG